MSKTTKPRRDNDFKLGVIFGRAMGRAEYEPLVAAVAMFLAEIEIDFDDYEEAATLKVLKTAFKALSDGDIDE